MRDAITFLGAFVIYYVGLLVTGVVAFVVLALLVRWVCPCRNCQVRRRGRSTRTSIRPHRGGDTSDPGVLARVGRPARSWVWPENSTSIDMLMSDLADGGDVLLKLERTRR